MKKSLLTATAIMLFSLPVLAQDPVAEDAAATTSVASVPVLSGGVGAPSRDMLAEAEKDYNVKLVFTGDKGMYLADIAVTIQNNKGEILAEHVTDGPIMLAKLDAGKYKLTAVFEGVEKTAWIQADGALHTYHMRFPAQDDMSYMQVVPEEDMPQDDADY